MKTTYLLIKEQLYDLRLYTSETGGEHGLDDVTKGLIYLDEKFNVPHCKIHGAMLKVSSDGIWRCADPVHHGCFFDNILKT